MSQPGDNESLIPVRSALLDALHALRAHRDAVILVGAQAIYLHTGAIDLALAEATYDSDLVLDPRRLDEDPLIEAAMASANFIHNPNGQPGAWLSVATGIPVDVMVPDALSTRPGRRAAWIPPHDKNALRSTVGLEAALIDHSLMTIAALATDDPRNFSVNVAGPAALLVAKLHKLGERRANGRLQNKDAHDVFRLLNLPTEQLASTISRLRDDPLAGPVTRTALTYLQEMFAAGPQALGSVAAGLAEQDVGDPDVTAAAAAALADDLITSLGP